MFELETLSALFWPQLPCGWKRSFRQAVLVLVSDKKSWKEKRGSTYWLGLGGSEGLFVEGLVELELSEEEDDEGDEVCVEEVAVELDLVDVWVLVEVVVVLDLMLLAVVLGEDVDGLTDELEVEAVVVLGLAVEAGFVVVEVFAVSVLIEPLVFVLLDVGAAQVDLLLSVAALVVLLAGVEVVLAVASLEASELLWLLACVFSGVSWAAGAGVISAVEFNADSILLSSCAS